MWIYLNPRLISATFYFVMCTHNITMAYNANYIMFEEMQQKLKQVMDTIAL